MRAYSLMVLRSVLWFSLVTLAGCFSSGANPPGANAPCKTDDTCAPGYKCLLATTGASGLFCCKDENSCGPVASAGVDGAAFDAPGLAIDGIIAIDRSSSIDGAIAIDGAVAGGAGGTGVADGGYAGAGGSIGGSTNRGDTAGASGSGSVDGGSPDTPEDAPAPNPDATLLALGKACTADTDCALGNCVDGRCCNKSKAVCGGCTACTNASTGLDDGTCGPVSAGNDPHETCANETAANQCGNDGTCDGKGACRKVSNNHTCTPASCSTDGKTFTAATTCDGAGACTTATPQGCAPFQCAATGCLQTCSAQADCVGNTYCNTSVAPAVCAAKKTNGQPASQSYECTSNVVADGVCCDQTCSGCSACTVALNKQPGVLDGKCLAVLQGEVGHGTCTANPPCGLDGKCDGNGNCRYTAINTPCPPDSCSADHLSQITMACSSTHTCAGTTSGCQNSLICDQATGNCKTGCSIDGDCVAGKFCSSSGTCALKAQGIPCTGAAQCASNFCVDGYCCNGACIGSCEACNRSGHLGACTALPAGSTPQSGHPACAATDARCPSTCQGSNTCTPSINACGQTSCSSDHLSYGAAGTCSNGTCNIPPLVSCGAGKYCPSSAGTCVPQTSGSCSNSYECVTNYCTGGTCCNPGWTGCSGTCADVSSDPAHCGGCAFACDPTVQACNSGLCKLLDHQACTSDSQCSSNNCAPGTIGASNGFCCPSGTYYCEGSCIASGQSC